MKIYISQQNYHIGNFAYNSQKIIEAIQDAKNKAADLVVFSELAICGYPARDFLYFDDFIENCWLSALEIAKHTENIAVIVGCPTKNNNKLGKKLFNSALFIRNGNIEQIVHKTLLPTYDVFDEYRYFEPANNWQTIQFMEKRIALTICEDIWNVGNNRLYTTTPMEKLMDEKPDMMINISASPFDYQHEQERRDVITQNVTSYHLPMIYCNTVGSQTEIVFDGGSVAVNTDLNFIAQLKQFKEDYKLVEFTNNEFKVYGDDKDESENKLQHTVTNQAFNAKFNIEKIYTCLQIGIADYFKKMSFSKAIIGSSGGIDSAVTLAIACSVLGEDNVLAVLMPTAFSSSHSITDAEALSKNLNNPYQIVPIEDVFQSVQKAVKPIFNDLPFGLAEENMQSRIRGNIVMSIANKFGYILLNTSNKSELATGYGTLYGDMAGGLSVLGDCYKTQVYELANYINELNGFELIPHNIITKAPSAELRPNQKDSDSLPDYAVLDEILYQYIELQKSPNQIKMLGYDALLVDKILKLVNLNEYKRNQFCPIIRVSPKAFGIGRRIPIVANYLM